MRKVIHLATTTALIVFLAAHSVAAQTSSEMWRSFAERVDVGTELNVRLNKRHVLGPIAVIASGIGSVIGKLFIWR